MTLSTALADAVAETIRDRGRAYYRAGAVNVVTLGAAVCVATVRGSARYDVELRVEARQVHASCSCPYGFEYGAACKHVWAAVLAAEARGFASGAASSGPLRLVLDDYEFDEDEYDRSRRPLPPAAPTTLRAAPRPEAWQEQLAALRREPHAPAAGGVKSGDRELLYVFDVPGSVAAKKLVVEVNFRDRKRGGGVWG